MKTKTTRTLAILLTLVITLGLLPAAALEQNKQTTTDRYINEADNREIAAAETVKSTEIKTPQKISDYVYESFSEVTDHIYAKEDLVYINGYPDKTVRGERYLSRAEAAAIFYRLYDGFYPTVQRQMTSKTFSDIPSAAWYSTELELCYNVGLIGGYPDGTFRPDDAITRAEFSKIAAQFAELSNSDKASFKDVTKDHWAYLFINAAADAGWIKGYPDGTYRPETIISRSETVTLINRMRNRSITTAELKKLGVTNPYTDLVDTYWAYADLLEATVTHSVTDWHKLTYKGGTLNTIVEKYVDGAGKEIAKPTITAGKTNYAPRPFDRHHYLGYVTTVTYVYSDGNGSLLGTKSVDKSTAKVGDTLTYTITASNKETATANLENVVMTDAIPSYLSFVHGSVQVEDLTTQYSYSNGTLSVNLGSIAPGKSKKITFTAVVNDTAYGKNFKNTAVLSAADTGEKTVTDNGVIIDDGKTGLTAKKSVDTSTAKVGDTLTYTITASNGESATAALKNVIMRDKISDYTTFTHGSVQVDGKTAQYAYDNKSKELVVDLGDLTAGQTKTITFSAVVSNTAYGKTFNNIAVLSSDNTDDMTVIDESVSVSDGITRMFASKAVNKSTAKVGDTLTYTITVGNEETATADLKTVVMRDVIPEYLDFSYGSVQVDGAAAKYTYDSDKKLLMMELGDIAPGQVKRITFAAVIKNTAYNKTFKNTAILTATNADNKSVTDAGTTVDDGTARLIAAKSVNKSTAKVGDTLTYTITATNSDAATVNLRNAVMNDTISEYLTFTQGSVQVDGYSAKYSYNNETKTLTVPLADIAPGQTKTITFTAVVNTTAYGKTVNNTAILAAENDTDKPATDDGVTVENGTAEGSVGAKTVSKSSAKVGETLTYTITLRNASTATAPWKNVKVSDAIPEYLAFVSGSVEEDGRTSANASYNAGTKNLTLFADSIEPGETKTFTFKAVVENGAQGKYIVNTAIVKSDGREDIQLPDTGVQIDAGNAVPTMTKTASVNEAGPGDIFTYTVTMKNAVTATADWKNVILSDTLPAGVKLVSGSVTLNGKTVSYGISGQAIEVTVGDLKPGQDAIVSFEVRVLDNVAGTTIQNVAVAKGDNGEKTATDTGVTVPDPEDEPQDGDGDGDSTDKNTVTGTKTVDKTMVTTGEKVTYSFTATNNSTETWTGVFVYDVLDTSMLTFIDDSVYIGGIRYLTGVGKWTFVDKQLVINLGDIAPGQTVKCSFNVQFKNDAANSVYTNHATINSINEDGVYVRSPEVMILGGSGSSGDNTYFTNLHFKLFSGYVMEDGDTSQMWKPNDNMRLSHICMIGYRLMTDHYRNSLGNGTITVPEHVVGRELQFFVSHGIISASEVVPAVDATQSQIHRVLNFAIGSTLSSGSTSRMSRVSVATLICNLTNRDTSPNTNGLPVAYFPDKGAYAGLIDELSNSHDYTMDSSGNETWISILKD